MVDFPKVEIFKGLNNRVDPIRLGLEWQLQADNCLCDDAGFLTRRPGITENIGSGYKDVYGTRDGRLLAIDSSDRLVQIDEAGSAQVLQTGITGAPFQWAELGYAVFLLGANNSKWAVYPDQVIAWGSLCPSVSVSYPVGDPISYPPPNGNLIGTYRSQLVIAAWEPEFDRSVVYFSRPDYPHEFRLERDYQLFAGKITLLADTANAFVIATDRAIYLDYYDRPITRVAEYGVAPGGFLFDEYDTVWFWSERGLCKAAPFENITDKQLAVTERKIVTGAVLAWQGSRYAVVQQIGDTSARRKVHAYEPLAVSNVMLVSLDWKDWVLSIVGGPITIESTVALTWPEHVLSAS